PGCWRLSAAVDGRVLGSAVVDVAPAPLTTPVPRVPLHVVGTASGCFSIGGCAYFGELSGEGTPSQRAGFESVVPPAGATPPVRGGPRALVLTDLTDTLPPGFYHLDFEAFWMSDAIVSGGRDMTLMTSCTISFEARADGSAVSIVVSFTADACEAVERRPA